MYGKIPCFFQTIHSQGWILHFEGLFSLLYHFKTKNPAIKNKNMNKNFNNKDKLKLCLVTFILSSNADRKLGNTF